MKRALSTRAGRGGLILGAVVLAALLWLGGIRPAWAAIQLAYFRGTNSATSVLLEWATVREINLSGFEILCKHANEPDTAYHPIGSRIAQGSAEAGAAYSFAVTTGLEVGEAYCFRLREVTTDGVPGEFFDLCGYGPGLPQPTPVDPSQLPTVIPLQEVPGLDPAPTLPPTPFPGDPFQSPLPTPFDPNSASLGGGEVAPTPFPQGEFPTPTATWTPEFFVPTWTPTFTPTPIGNSPLTTDPGALPPPQVAAVAPEMPPAAIPPAAPPVEVAPAEAAATPTPLYIVVTATPTPQAEVVIIAPTYTPWPTASPTPSFGLAELLVPNTQNMMVMLLCLIFLSASGLGALGLITSVLYMRAQSRRNQLPGPRPYDRRRY
jgi:hypothetical protein